MSNDQLMFQRTLPTKQRCDQIKLSSGDISLVSKKDLKKVNQYNWYIDGHGYVYRKMYIGKNKYKNQFLHRFIMDNPLGKTIDHINGNKLDNRRENLRICTQSENIKNMKIKLNNKTGYRGVYFRKDGKRIKRYTSQLEINDKKYVKRFLTAKEADIIIYLKNITGNLRG